MKKKDFWIDEYNINIFNVDFEKKITLTSIFNFFQQTAFHHAEYHNIGYENLKKNNEGWLLAKLYLEINKLPEWRDKIFFKTWSKGPKRLYALRDFQIIDENKNILCNGGSAWILYDLKRGRPKKVDNILEDFPVFKDNHALEYDLSKIEELYKPKEVYSYTVKYSDIDLNNHVNNTKYIEWIMNGFDMDFYKENKIKRFRIDFMSEAVFKDLVVINKEEKQKKIIINCIRKSDGKEIIRSSIELF